MVTAVARTISVKYRGACQFNTIDRDRSQMAASNVCRNKPTVGKDSMARPVPMMAVIAGGMALEARQDCGKTNSVSFDRRYRAVLAAVTNFASVELNALTTWVLDL